MWAAAAWISGFLCACSGIEDQPVGGQAELLAQNDLGAELAGVSGLTPTESGGWLAVEERGERLVLLEGGPTPQVVGLLPIANLPEDVDLESIAARGRTLTVGTEAQSPRRETDLLLTLELGTDSAAVVDRRELHYGHFGLTAGTNQGIEAVCTSGSELFVGAEPTGSVDGRRRAAAWRIQGDTVVPIWLGLTTREGKLAGLTCAPSPDGGTTLWGIERHYETRRILRWSAPPMARWLQELPPDASWDLDPALPGAPNPEGIALVAVDGDRATFAIIVDNDHGGEKGATTLYRVGLAPISAPR